MIVTTHSSQASNGWQDTGMCRLMAEEDVQFYFFPLNVL